MRESRRVLGAILLAALLALMCFGPRPAQAADKSLRFDCGTADSPVMAGYQRLTADDMYSQGRGYGWEGSKPQSVEFEKPSAPTKGDWMRADKVFEDNLTDLNRDAVVSENDLVFRADVPNGTCRVSLLIGDMFQGIGSIDVLLSGKPIGEHVAAFSLGGYRLPFKTPPLGWWTKLRHTVDATDGSIQVVLRKNQTYYDNQMADQSTWLNPYRKYWWTGAPEKEPPYYYIGWPFVHNSLMAIEILPDVPPPVVGENDKLTLAKPISSPALLDAVAKFNAGDFLGSTKALDGVTEPEAQVAKAAVQLWLAGRIELEMEQTLVPAALKTLRDYVPSHPAEVQLAELLDDAEIFNKALSIHLTRGQLGKNHFRENDKAIGWWWLIQQNSPLYYTSQLYIARALNMLVPYIPTLGTEAEILKKLEKKFPDNRYVKFLLHWTWEPRGDGSRFDDWYMVDYASKVKDAPKWVQYLYPAWATLLDWSEWFLKWKQGPEGGIGGGLSDDVELVGAFGYMGYTSRGVSELTTQGARKVCEGNWQFGKVDDETGFYMPFADAEHTAEATGDTLGMMMQIDYGTPVWIERGMKTGKLIRDFWTEFDKNGYRHFRSNYFSAIRMGTAAQMNDSWINYRAVKPAGGVLWYNQNPTISKLFVELADGWLAAALSTERGKPKGIIPAEVSFPDGIIGGADSPNWYTASHPEGTTNYDWWWESPKEPAHYKGYIHDLLLTAFDQTRDPKYLEPLRLEYELAARYGEARKELTSARLQQTDRPQGYMAQFITGDWQKLGEGRWWQEPASKPALAEAAQVQGPEPGSEAWAAPRLTDTDKWLAAKQVLEGRKGDLKNDITKEDIYFYCGYANAIVKFRWPHMTTMSSATDRVAFAGIVNPFLIYTGGHIGGPLLEAAVTYENTTREFAAAVMATDHQGFRLIYYSLAPDTREIGICPWHLEPGATYRLRYGPDANDDTVMDSVSAQREFVLPQRGTPIHVSVEPRKVYVVEVDQVARGKAGILAPDAAVAAADIRYEEQYGVLVARVHNIGSEPVRRLQVAFYDGDPAAGGKPIGTSLIPYIEAPIDLDAKAVNVGINWMPTAAAHEIYVVLDPDGEIKDEITTFNNVAHAKLPAAESAPIQPKPQIDLSVGRGR